MPKPNKDLKCFMKTAKNGAVYRTCIEKDKKPYKANQNLRGDPKRTGRSYPRDVAYLKSKDIPKNPASIRRKKGKKATERGTMLTKGDGSKTITLVGLTKTQLDKENKQRAKSKADKKKALQELLDKKAAAKKKIADRVKGKGKVNIKVKKDKLVPDGKGGWKMSGKK